MLTEELCFDYIIRFRGNIAVTATAGETRTAAAWRVPVDAPACCAQPRHRRPLCRGNRGLRSASGHEAGLVSGRQQPQRRGQCI
jgi:hypothetical protein